MKKIKHNNNILVSIEEALNEYEQDLHIDPLALDEEFEEQPRRFMKYAKATADARRQKDLAKKKLMLAQAQVRSRLTKTSRGAVTAPMVEEQLLQTEEWANYKRWSYRHEILEEGAKKAFWQRKEAIEGLIKLVQMEYCAKPRLPKSLEWQEKQRNEVRNGIKKSLNKK